jgi:hypothetical protein
MPPRPALPAMIHAAGTALILAPLLLFEAADNAGCFSRSRCRSAGRRRAGRGGRAFVAGAVAGLVGALARGGGSSCRRPPSPFWCRTSPSLRCRSGTRRSCRGRRSMRSRSSGSCPATSPVASRRSVSRGSRPCGAHRAAVFGGRGLGARARVRRPRRDPLRTGTASGPLRAGRRAACAAGELDVQRHPHRFPDPDRRTCLARDRGERLSLLCVCGGLFFTVPVLAILWAVPRWRCGRPGWSSPGCFCGASGR